MKHFFSVLLVVLSVGSASACAKKSTPVENRTPLTVIVMDTTQALLPDACVAVGKSEWNTSFDGRVVLKPEQWSSARQITVSCRGYEKVQIKTASLPASGEPLVVALTPKKAQKGTEKPVLLGDVRSGGMVYYKRDTRVMAEPVLMATADYAVAEEAMEMDMVPMAGAANTVSAGLLTAGEVNDFARWNFWLTVMDSTHRRFVDEWRIAPRERYTVQVTDRHGYPVVNYPVSLTDAKGNTLFQAVTDNTGKAELWGGLLRRNDEQGKTKDALQIRADGYTAGAKQWQEIIVDAPCIAEMTNDPMVNGVDVFFIFDATGSMGDELRYLQAEMKDVIARAKDATGGLAIRTGAVVYRDHGDDYITRISRLTEDLSVTQTFIDKQEADGGGDYPEAVPEALMAALNSAGWSEQARARIAFLVLDAPCHQDSATLALLHDQILNAAAVGVRLVPVVCSGLGESGEYLLRTMALATNGTSFFLTDDSGIGHEHLRPTTDSLVVEHLNDMLVRTIVEFSYMPDCRGHWHQDEIEQVNGRFIPDPFTAEQIAQDPSIPHGPTTLYLLDISGKLITVYQGRLDEAGDSQLSALSLHLSTGIYFIKAFYDGQWHTKKILVH